MPSNTKCLHLYIKFGKIEEDPYFFVSDLYIDIPVNYALMFHRWIMTDNHVSFEGDDSLNVPESEIIAEEYFDREGWLDEYSDDIVNYYIETGELNLELRVDLEYLYTHRVMGTLRRQLTRLIEAMYHRSYPCFDLLNDEFMRNLWGEINNEKIQNFSNEFTSVRNHKSRAKLYPAVLEGGFPNESRWGFVNSKGVKIIPPIYQAVSYFENECAICSIDLIDWLIINEEGKTINSLNDVEYAGINVSDFHGFLKQNDLYAIIGTNENLIKTPIQYDRIEQTIDGQYTIVSLNGFYGLVNDCGQEILYPIFDSIEFYENFHGIIIQKNGLKALYSRNEPVFRSLFIYQEIIPEQSEFSLARKNNLWAGIDVCTGEICTQKVIDEHLDDLREMLVQFQHEKDEVRNQARISHKNGNPQDELPF